LILRWRRTRRGGSGTCHGSDEEAELLKLQKRGKFPDEPVKIKGAQIHCFFSRTPSLPSRKDAQLFGRVHAMSEEVFEKEQEDVPKGLDMTCPAMRDDSLPRFLHLLQSGEGKQRSRVMQVAAELGMQFVSKSRESLDTLAQALLSEVAEGCTLADLMEGGSLLEEWPITGGRKTKLPQVEESVQIFAAFETFRNHYFSEILSKSDI
jgi:hypothetical protein